ncbi:MAG TPA: excinuclease ABC subunit UvrC, partial [Candidatus Kapabacteria bacterium]|nr:excinuclease ABC subunit UvrC [Candidatus Kapabacteria bacterium]
DGRYMYYLLDTLRSMFPLRSCDLPLTEESIEKKKYKVCLDYHIKRCEGPCEDFVNQVHYMEHIKSVVAILQGKTKELEQNIEAEMMRAADELRFESAAELRNRLVILKEYVSKQKIVSADDKDQDIFALSRDDEDACVVVFTVREGKMIGKRHFYIGNSVEQTESEILRQTVEKWYIDTDMIPEEIILQEEIESADIIAEWLEKRRGSRIEFTIPKICDKKKLISLAKTNADYLLRELHVQRAAKENALPRGIAALQRDLRLSSPPRRIECFDNSHMQGSDYVSSMVCFIDGKPKKNDYRRFKLKTVQGNDDFAAMREVVERRYSRVLAEKTEKPDLIIIDGGKGQL